MAATATKPLTAPTEPATPLERLHAERAELTSELAALNASSARLRETANAEAAVLKEIGAMGSAEIAAVTAWASGGCVGDQPPPDLKLRRSLGEKLAAAQAAVTAAKGAGADIDQKVVVLNERLRVIGAWIEEAALDAMQAEVTDIRSEHLAAVERVRKSSVKLLGLCSYLSNEGRRRIDHGDVEGGKRYLAKAEAMNAIKLPGGGVTQGEIIEAANDWSRLISKHRAGT